MNKQKLKELLNFAQKLAEKTGSMLVEKREGAKINNFKGRVYDYATDVDLLAEHLIVEEIRKKYPTHEILSEEAGEIKGEGDFRWIIDPLDGTWPYSKGLNGFGTILSLEYKKELVLGIFYKPKLQELLKVGKGLGAFRDKQKMVCSIEPEIDKATIYMHYSRSKLTDELTEKQLSLYKRLIDHVGQTVFSYTTSFDLPLLAQGSIEGVVRFPGSIHWWDVGAGILMIREAGGRVTNFEGKETNSQNFVQGLIASNGKIHNQLLKIVNAKI